MCKLYRPRETWLLNPVTGGRVDDFSRHPLLAAGCDFYKCLSSLSSQTLGPSRQCGKSNSTITTSETTASGEARSPSLSMNASPTKPAASCGWTRSPSSEEGSFWCCKTISRNRHLDKPAQALTKAHHTMAVSQWPPTHPSIIVKVWFPSEAVPMTSRVMPHPRKFSFRYRMLVSLHLSCLPVWQELSGSSRFVLHQKVPQKDRGVFFPRQIISPLCVHR